MRTEDVPEKLTTKQAATELGVSEQCVREGMKRGTLDIGIVIPTSGKKLKYLIYRNKLDVITGKKGSRND